MDRENNRYEVLGATLVSVAFAVFFGSSILQHLSTEGLPQDWDFLLQLRWAASNSLLQFHQFPFWNPYKCGGMPLLANPQADFLTPLFFLDLVFGPVVGVHLQIVI